MKISQKRQIDRFKRSLDFVQKHEEDFSPNSQGIKTRDQLQDVVSRAESNVAEDETTKPGRRPYRSDKLLALNALRTELSRISRTATLIAAKDESFHNSFAMPDKRRKNDLAAAARHFIEEYPKVSDKFEDFELKADEIENLKSALADYEQVQAAPAAKPASQTRTPASTNPTVAQGIELVDALDIIMGNKYSKSPEILDAWKETSALEVTRRRRKNKSSDS